MRLLADENTHPAVVARLRQAGHVVEWLHETTPGIADEAILQRPDIGGIVLITNDRDFGALIFHRGHPAPRAILYTRLPHRAAETTADRIIALLAAEIPDDHMITITKDGERVRPFSSGAE